MGQNRSAGSAGSLPGAGVAGLEAVGEDQRSRRLDAAAVGVRAAGTDALPRDHEVSGGEKQRDGNSVAGVEKILSQDPYEPPTRRTKRSTKPLSGAADDVVVGLDAVDHRPAVGRKPETLHDLEEAGVGRITRTLGARLH